MLIEALKNIGACASGFPYAPGVSAMSEQYKNVLERVRDTQKFLFLEEELESLAKQVMDKAGNNQRDRLKKIVEGLDIYIKREYNKG